MRTIRATLLRGYLYSTEEGNLFLYNIYNLPIVEGKSYYLLIDEDKIIDFVKQ